MPIIASSKAGTDYSPVSEGVHVAICYSIVDLGLQYSELYKNSNRKVLITFELPEETIVVDGKELPRAISKEYTLSLSEKSILRKDLQAWRGKAFTEAELDGFDLQNVLGKGCQAQILHTERNGKTYANVASIMGLPKGMKTGDAVNELVYFDMESPEALNLLGKLPQWVQDKIKKSETYTGLMSKIDAPHSLPEDETYSDLPF